MRWEYKTFSFKKRSFFTSIIDAEAFQAQLNELGRDGWELVSVTQSGTLLGILVVMKRSR